MENRINSKDDEQHQLLAAQTRKPERRQVRHDGNEERERPLLAQPLARAPSASLEIRQPDANGLEQQQQQQQQQPEQQHKKKKAKTPAVREKRPPCLTETLVLSEEEKIVRYATETHGRFMETLFPLLKLIGFEKLRGVTVYKFGNDRFEGEEEVRFFLLQKGIPNAEKLNLEQKKYLSAWAKYANTRTSDLTLHHPLLLSDKEIELLLEEKFDLVKNENNIFSSKLTGAVLGELNVIRAKIRGHGAEALHGPEASRQASRLVRDLNQIEKISLRLWAARSVADLPEYNPPTSSSAPAQQGGNNNERPSENEQEPSSTHGVHKTAAASEDQPHITIIDLCSDIELDDTPTDKNRTEESSGEGFKLHKRSSSKSDKKRPPASTHAPRRKVHSKKEKKKAPPAGETTHEASPAGNGGTSFGKNIGNDIWPVLRDLPYFQYKNRRYSLLDEDGQMVKEFENPDYIKKFMVRYGIPGLERLDTASQEFLKNEVAGIYVDGHALKSAQWGMNGLDEADLEIPSDDRILGLLQEIGFARDERGIFYAPNVDQGDRANNVHKEHFFLDMDEVREYVRSHKILAATDGKRVSARAGSRRCHTESLDDKKKNLSLRLWAAESKEPLPEFDWEHWKDEGAKKPAATERVTDSRNKKGTGTQPPNHATQAVASSSSENDSMDEEALEAEVERLQAEVEHLEKKTRRKQLQEKRDRLLEKKKKLLQADP